MESSGRPVMESRQGLEGSLANNNVMGIKKNPKQRDQGCSLRLLCVPRGNWSVGARSVCFHGLHGYFNFPSRTPSSSACFLASEPVNEPVELVQEPAWSSNRGYYGHHAACTHGNDPPRDYRRLRSSSSGSSGSIKEGPKKQR